MMAGLWKENRPSDRPDVHQRAIEARVKLGTVKAGSEIGLAGETKYVWDACPVCDKRRWVRLRDKQRGDPLWCRKCASKRRARYEPMLKASEAGLEKRRLTWTLGKLCVAAGLTEASLSALLDRERSPR